MRLPAVLALVALALGAASARAADLDDLLQDLQIVPFAGARPPSFSLPSLDGRRVGLTDLDGRAALLYFWKSG